MSESALIVLTCPSCGKQLSTPRSTIGTSVGCPRCSAIIPVKDPIVPTPMIVDPKRRLGIDPRTAPISAEDPAFRDRLHRTSEETFKVDPENPVMVRRDHRKAKHGATLTEWDNKPRRRAHRHRGARRHLIPVLIGASILLTIALIAIFWQRLHKTENPHTAAPPSGPKALELLTLGDFRDQAWETIRQFATASTEEALLPLIRDPERVGPLLLKFYNSENPWIPLSLSRQAPDLSGLQVHKNFLVLLLPLSDYSARAIALEQTPDGFRVDWESFVGYSELSWPDLQRTRPTKPIVLRAVIKPSDYFNADFPTSETHRCFQLSDLKSDHVLYGYVPLNSDAFVQIQKILLGAPFVNAVIRVRYPEISTNDRQLEITEVLEKGWIFREDDIPDSTLHTSPLDLPSPTGGGNSLKP